MLEHGKIHRLKRCPFCGAGAKMIAHYGSESDEQVLFRVQCLSASAHALDNWHTKTTDAVREWNKRFVSEETEEEYED